jgi:hypothetical protein
VSFSIIGKSACATIIQNQFTWRKEMPTSQSTANTPVSHPGKHRCPVNGREYPSVSTTTILHHITEPWNWDQKEQGYYFCDDPDCHVVYYGQDNSIIEKNALRTPVGLKQKTDTALVCYCFGVHMNEARADGNIREFVVEKTRERSCACEIRNPSGRCCLKDFPK